MDNSLDLISDINKQIKKLSNKTQKGGAIKKLKSFRDNKYKFLSTKEKTLLTQKINTIIAGKGKNISKIHYDFFEIENKKKYNDVGKRGQLSKELEKIIGGAEKFKKNPDIEQLLETKTTTDIIDTEMIDDLIKLKGGSARSGSKKRPTRKARPNTKQSGKKKGVKGKKKSGAKEKKTDAKGTKKSDAKEKKTDAKEKKTDAKEKKKSDITGKSKSKEPSPEPQSVGAAPLSPTALAIKDAVTIPLPNPSMILTPHLPANSDLMPAGPLVITDATIPQVPTSDAPQKCNPSTKEAIIDIFNKITGNKTGNNTVVKQGIFVRAIKKSEHKKAIRNFFGLPTDTDVHESSQEGADLIAKLTLLFQTIDADGDKIISQDELLSYCASETLAIVPSGVKSDTSAADTTPATPVPPSTDATTTTSSNEGAKICNLLETLFKTKDLAEGDKVFVKKLKKMQEDLEDKLKKDTNSDLKLTEAQKTLYGNKLAIELFQIYAEFNTQLLEILEGHTKGGASSALVVKPENLKRDQYAYIMSLFVDKVSKLLGWFENPPYLNSTTQLTNKPAGAVVKVETVNEDPQPKPDSPKAAGNRIEDGSASKVPNHPLGSTVVGTRGSTRDPAPPAVST